MTPRVTRDSREGNFVAQFDDLSLALKHTVEQVLTTSFNDASPGSAVYRCAVRKAPFAAPASVIVKRVGGEGEPYNADADDGPAAGLFNEWAGLQFLDQLAGDRSPAARFYGGDRIAGLVVLEDLGADAHLDRILLGNDPSAAEEALIGLATTLGRMQALTVGKSEQYHHLRASLGPVNPDLASYASYDWLSGPSGKFLSRHFASWLGRSAATHP